MKTITDPQMTPETLNFNGIERISDFAHGLVLDLISADERPEYVLVERSQSEEGSRDTLRHILGRSLTIQRKARVLNSLVFAQKVLPIKPV